MKNHNVKNYSSELLLTKELVEMIKDYYKARGVPTYGMKIFPSKDIDEYGSTLYTIRSNIIFDCNLMVMNLG